MSQYRARAAAAREPVIYPMMDAIPTMPVVPKSAAPVARNGHSHDSRFLANLAVEAAVLLAIVALIPDAGPPAGDGSSDDQLRNMVNVNSKILDNITCGSRGGSVNAGGDCNL